jgi:hypothetical protein
VLVSRQVNDVDSVWKRVDRGRRAIKPGNPAHRPHPAYLDWHRQHRFKQQFFSAAKARVRAVSGMPISDMLTVSGRARANRTFAMGGKRTLPV